MVSVCRWCLLVVLLLTAPAWAQSQSSNPIAVRYGNHPGFGRLVFDTADGAAVPANRSGDVVTVQLGRPSRVDDAMMPHNVRAVRSDLTTVTFEIAAGAMLRRSIVNRHLVLDVLDPPSPTAAIPREPAKPLATVQMPKPSSNDRAHVEAAAQEPGGRFVRSAPEAHEWVQANDSAAIGADADKNVTAAVMPASSAGASADATTGPLAVQASDVGKAALLAASSTVPEAGPGHRLSVPFGPQVGAAAFRRGADAIVVFDERKPIDLSALQDDPVFGHATVQLLPTATVLRMKLVTPAELRLERRAGAWIVTAIGGDAVPSPLQPILPDQAGGTVSLLAPQPGLVVSMPDVTTGGILIVGTQRAAGQGVAVARRSPEFMLLPTWQGVVVEAISDSIALHATTAGFELSAEGDGEALVSSSKSSDLAVAAEASRLSRAFDIPDLPTNALIRRMQGAVISAAATPVQSRAEPRRAVAESMIALGMGVEAQALLGLAATGDARSSEDPTAVGLSAIAGLLAGRTAEAAGIDDPRLDGTDEVAFWRAVRTAMGREGAPAAAQTFANTLPLLLNYPSGLRERLLPLVAETMALGGQAAAAQILVDQRKEDGSLDMARGLLLQAQAREKGEAPTAALAIFDRIAHTVDRLGRFHAAIDAAELRLSSGAATPAQTAETLGKLLFAWRGDDHEVDLRLRVAELQAQSDQWRPALKLLRETEADWPDRRASTHARLQATLAQAVSPTAQASLKPFDLVALVEENADLMPDGEAGQQLAEHVCDQLVALDLPERTLPFLEKMVATGKPGVSRAAFGAKLAAVRLQQGNASGAIDALSATVSDELPASLLEGRTITFAAAVARQGDLASATRALTELDTERGDLTLIDLAEAAKRWPEAVTAIRHYADRTIPISGPLTEAQAQLLLRFASAASQAGDSVGLQRLRSQNLSRMPGGKTADLFNLLTDQPVRAISDLARVTRDVALARAIPSALSAIATR